MIPKFVKRLYVTTVSKEGKEILDAVHELAKSHGSIALPGSKNYKIEECRKYLELYHKKLSEIKTVISSIEDPSSNYVHQRLLTLEIVCSNNCRYKKFFSSNLGRVAMYTLTNIPNPQKAKEVCFHFQQDLKEIEGEAIEYFLSKR